MHRVSSWLLSHCQSKSVCEVAPQGCRYQVVCKLGSSNAIDPPQSPHLLFAFSDERAIRKGAGRHSSWNPTYAQPQSLDGAASTPDARMARPKVPVSM